MIWRICRVLSVYEKCEDQCVEAEMQLMICLILS